MGTCTCTAQWTGVACQEPADPFCANTDCGGHGTCSNGACTCDDRWGGLHCRQRVDACPECQHCANRLDGKCCVGTCVIWNGQRRCRWDANHPDNTCSPPPFGDDRCWVNSCYLRGVCYPRGRYRVGTTCGSGLMCDSRSNCVGRTSRRRVQEEEEAEQEPTPALPRADWSSDAGKVAQERVASILTALVAHRPADTTAAPQKEKDFESFSFGAPDPQPEAPVEDPQLLWAAQEDARALVTLQEAYFYPAKVLRLVAVERCLEMDEGEPAIDPAQEHWIALNHMEASREYFKSLCRQSEVMDDTVVRSYMRLRPQLAATADGDLWPVVAPAAPDQSFVARPHEDLWPIIGER